MAVRNIIYKSFYNIIRDTWRLAFTALHIILLHIMWRRYYKILYVLSDLVRGIRCIYNMIYVYARWVTSPGILYPLFLWLEAGRRVKNLDVYHLYIIHIIYVLNNIFFYILYVYVLVGGHGKKTPQTNRPKTPKHKEKNKINFQVFIEVFARCGKR